MIDKLTEFIQRIFSKLPKTAPNAAMKYILWYALFLAFCASLDLLMLLTDWYVNGKPNLSEMRQFVSMMISGSAVAAIGFAARWLVDSDNNGVPDEAEKDRLYPPYPPGKEEKK